MGDTDNRKSIGDYTQIPIFDLPKPKPPSNQSGRFTLQYFDEDVLELLNKETQEQNIFYRDDNDICIPCFSILEMYPSNVETKDVPFKVVRDSNHNRVIVYELYSRTNRPINFTKYIEDVENYNKGQSSNRRGGGGKRRTKKRATK